MQKTASKNIKPFKFYSHPKLANFQGFSVSWFSSWRMANIWKLYENEAISNDPTFFFWEIDGQICLDVFSSIFCPLSSYIITRAPTFFQIPKINSQVGGVETDECDKNMSEFPYSAQKLCALQKIHTFPHSRDLLYCYLHDMSS